MFLEIRVDTNNSLIRKCLLEDIEEALSKSKLSAQEFCSICRNISREGHVFTMPTLEQYKENSSLINSRTAFITHAVLNFSGFTRFDKVVKNLHDKYHRDIRNLRIDYHEFRYQVLLCLDEAE